MPLKKGTPLKVGALAENVWPGRVDRADRDFYNDWAVAALAARSKPKSHVFGARLAHAIVLRHGLDGLGEKTLIAISEALGYRHRERSRQLLAQAYRLLRHPRIFREWEQARRAFHSQKTQ